MCQRTEQKQVQFNYVVSMYLFSTSYIISAHIFISFPRVIYVTIYLTFFFHMRATLAAFMVWGSLAHGQVSSCPINLKHSVSWPQTEVILTSLVV